ncbi:23S rRNA (uracil(1939)-C(5))-methyltransferase RlmD [Patescibacteria group bacterium]|nr:23S rRNA (uracil(1939)-C(5))-methyltransferase RlmD [Patescibacteria group bacterium]
MKFGHKITGKVERYDSKGRGQFTISNHEGTTSNVAVPFSAIGDELTATFIKRDSGFKIARLEEVQAPGPSRVEAPCPHAGVCGGCLWQHLGYDAQVDLKKSMVNAAFEQAGHVERIESVVPAVEQFKHRNRMDYAVGWNGEIGLKEYGSWNRYVDVKTCLLLKEDPAPILHAVKEWMHAHDLQPWDGKYYTGDIRYVVVRDGQRTNQRLVSVVIKDATRATAEMKTDLAERLKNLCTTLLLGEQSLQTDLSQAQTFEALIGEPWFEEETNGIRYRIHPNSFFQTNTAMAEKLQQLVGELVGAPAHLLDLYCGLGFFGIALAKKNPEMKISGFEIDAEAIELAKFNAKQNGVADRCDFTAGPAEDLSWKEISADVVILDPPRSGLHPKVLKTIREMKPKTLVYVSCNYHRLVEELKMLKESYRVEFLTAIDLFPHTPHVEVIAKLTLL